jgi:hypothetical protein
MKKSISIVIALILLVNVFAISAFAAVPSGNAIALTLSAEDKSYTAGETVMVTLSVETTSAVSGLYAGEVEVAYDSSIFEPVADLSQGPLLENYGCTEGTIISGNHEKSLSSVKPGGDAGFYPEDVAAYGWDAGFYIGIVENSAGFTPVDCSTGPQTFLTFPLKLKAGVADGSYTIGVNKCAFEGDNAVAFLTDETFGGIFGGMGGEFGVGDTDTYACGTLTITVGQGGVTPPPAQDPITVENISTQVQWQSKDEGLMRVAFRGNIKNYTLNLVDGSQTEIADIAEMGVVYSKSNTNPTVGGTGCTAAPAWTIYDFTTGGYFFRAVVGNYPYDNTETLYANAYIIIDGQTITASNGVTSTTGAAEYERATALGMATK